MYQWAMGTRFNSPVDHQIFRLPNLPAQPPSRDSVSHAILLIFHSSFIVDSADYLRRNGLARSEFLQPHERLLRTSRLRLKPLEVKDRPFEEMLNEKTNTGSMPYVMIVIG